MKMILMKLFIKNYLIKMSYEDLIIEDEEFSCEECEGFKNLSYKYAIKLKKNKFKVTKRLKNIIKKLDENNFDTYYFVIYMLNYLGLNKDIALRHSLMDELNIKYKQREKKIIYN